VAQPFTFGIVLEIHYHRALVAIEALERRRRIAPEGRSPCPAIVAVELLDLDDIGAKVAEDFTSVWRRYAVSELNDGDAVERQGLLRHVWPRETAQSAAHALSSTP